MDMCGPTGADIKKYLFLWLFERSDKEIFITAGIAGGAVFPLVWPDTHIILRMRHAEKLYVDDTGISARVSLPGQQEEHCFFPWDNVAAIFDEDEFLFQFKNPRQVPEDQQDNRVEELPRDEKDGNIIPFTKRI